MDQLFFLRHFKTKPDRSKPVSEWGLDKEGLSEMDKLLKSDRLKNIDIIFSSPESKALLTARKMGEKYQIPVVECNHLVEVDRTQSGFIEGDYLNVATEYLGGKNSSHPWETLPDVKKRIRAFLSHANEKGRGNVLVVSHGLFLSVLLSEYFGKKPADYWNSLKFGQIITANPKKLNTIWNQK
jgi:broad specificity phosphatase PhoE